MAIQKITPFLWFDTQAEEAAGFYCSMFPNSRLGKIHRYCEGGMGPPGSVMTIEFTLDGQEFVGLNGGPIFKFTEAVSFAIRCETQEEIDHYWTKLTSGGGAEVQCGWLKDKFGLSWQVVPAILGKLMEGGGKKSAAVMTSLLKMKKLDIRALQESYDNA
jgi:predicted 3-demethylubiquinone-9 3-methyltransferase (glyoxalase superfamily)